MKSWGIVFTGPEKVEFREQKLPALGSTEVRCKAKCSMISIGTETLCLKGIFDPNTGWASWVQYPFYPGYSMVAEVIEAGPDVVGFQVGDRVAAAYSHKQYFQLDYHNVKKVPEALSDEQATWMQLSKITQVGVRRAELKLGESVGVIGLGQLGQLVVRYLSAFGARHIIAIDPVQGRLDMASKGGATHLIATDALNASDEVRRITEGKMLDVVFDITGHPAVLSPATLLLRELGRVVLLGDTTTPSKQHLGPRVVSDSIAILGIHASMTENYYGVKADDMTNLFFDFLQQGRMSVDQLVTKRISPIEAPGIYEGLLKDRSSSMAVLFDWSLVD